MPPEFSYTSIVNMDELESRYDHKAIEGRIYKRWEESGYFNPDNLPVSRVTGHGSRVKDFCIIMPPPNANGPLHVGHAFEVAIQDLLIRFWRMRGRRALWLPGADHAGFETQVVFDKKLEKEGRNRFAIEREKLFREIWNFTQENKKIMEGQLRKLGASCDWSRETFTLDPDIVEGVYATFKKLYDDGLVYRDVRVVNWCTKHRTALSDLEVRYVERKDPLYFIKYGPLTLATVRPETKFGDTGLAVNPKDRRYKNYVGKIIDAKGLLGPLRFTVIADEAVDPSFGTGVVKVTPAHDAADFEIWKRHKEKIDGPKLVIGEDGRLMSGAGRFAGMKVADARAKVAEEMKNIGILEKVDPEYVHQVATCYKCGMTLEPLPKPQWFIKTQPLAKKAIAAVKQRKIQFYPAHAKKVYFHWLKNIRDWNISRQIVWGIRIPAWFRNGSGVMGQGSRTNEEIRVGEKPPEGEGWTQDPDVFDTWFSSGQWPFLTLGFKEGSRVMGHGSRKENDFETFYPTDVMAPGHEILFFWVARMIMLGLYRTGNIPFRTVYLHGIVRDKDRQKMSKSKGNVVDPLGVAETYGTDALRIALLAGTATGSDPVISEDKIRGYRNFATKLWNIARFVLMHKPRTGADMDADRRRKNQREFTLTAEDKANIKELKGVKKEITKHIEKFEFHLAAEKIYHYIWHTFADKIIEEYKPLLRRENGENSSSQKENLLRSQAAYHVLETILLDCLKMLHPFMPFITEEIYEKFRPEKLLLIKPW